MTKVENASDLFTIGDYNFGIIGDDAVGIDYLAQATGVAPSLVKGWKISLACGVMLTVAAYDHEYPIGRANVLWDETQIAPVDRVLRGRPFVFDVYVGRDQRRNGVARTLMQACEGLVKQRNPNEELMGLTVEPDNLAAISLYHTLGYRQELMGCREVVKNSWPELQPDGTVADVCRDVMLMTKQLATVSPGA